MAVTITLKKSSVANKRPLASSLVTGELALNSNSLSTGVFLLDDSNNVVKVGPTAVGPSAPNVAPAGSPGNSVGETWYDTTNSGLFVWDGSVWQPTGGSSSPATPTVEGIVFGCTTATNAALGCNALLNTSGNCNIALGRNAGCAITTGSCNIAIGPGAQVASPSGSCQLAIGFNSTSNWLTGDNSKAIRPGAGIIDCAGLCGAAGQVLQSNGANAVCWGSVPGTTAATPIALGTVYACTETNNVALGLNALLSNDPANMCCNTALGFEALKNMLSGSLNVGIGTCALGDSGVSGLVNGNVAIGFYAMQCVVGQDNTAVGRGSLQYSCGQQNVAIGAFALGAATNSGFENVAVGNFAMGLATDVGAFNVAVGACAMRNVQADSNCNVAIGHRAGDCLTIGRNNVFLGYMSGADGFCNVTTQCNRVILGNTFTNCMISRAPLTVPSDTRWKKVDGAVPLALPFVQTLNPIKYQFCDPSTGEVTDDRYRYGFSAQEVIANEVNPDHPIIASIDNPEMFALTESMLLPVLVNAIKELSAEVEALKARLPEVQG